MRRICVHCKEVYGEKCGRCGSVNVRKINMIAGPGWECLDCKARWFESSQHDTHGICPACVQAKGAYLGAA